MSKAKRTTTLTDQSGNGRDASQTDPDAQPTVVDESTDIPAALSPAEWHAWRTERLNPVTLMREVSAFAPNPDALWKAIAIANDQLHDDDPRKLTHDVVTALRAAAEALPEEGYNEATGASTKYSRLHELADVIESLLLPDV